jgi:hypothetical protein
MTSGSLTRASYAASGGEFDPKRFNNAPPSRQHFDIWLDCHTQKEIAEAVGVDHSTVQRWLVAKTADAEFATAPKSRQHFDIWQFATSKHAAEIIQLAPELAEQEIGKGKAGPGRGQKRWRPTA